MLQRVERRALGGEHRAGIAFEPHQHRAGLRPRRRRSTSALDPHFAVQRAEEGRGDVEPGDDDRLAAIHLGGEARVGRDRRVRRDVAALAEILGQHPADEFVEVEVRQVRRFRRRGVIDRSPDRASPQARASQAIHASGASASCSARAVSQCAPSRTKRSASPERRRRRPTPGPSPSPPRRRLRSG